VERNRTRGKPSRLQRSSWRLISIRSRPAADYEPRRRGAKKPRDRTQDEVLREIFEHNLELMKLTRGHGITASTGD